MRSLTAALFLFFNLLICSASGQTIWFSSTRLGNKALFLTTSSILTFDLDGGNWGYYYPFGRSGASAMAFDSNGGFVAFADTIYRYNTALASTGQFAKVSPGVVQKLYLDGNLVIAVHYDSNAFRQYYSIFDRQTGAQLSSLNVAIYQFSDMVHSPATKTILAYSGGNLAKVAYTQQGILSPPVMAYGTFAGNDPGQIKLWASPDGADLFSQAGRIFDVYAGKYAGSLGGLLQDLEFDSGSLYALSGTQLIQYSTSSYIETGRLALMSGGSQVYIQNGKVFVFSTNSTFVQGDLSLLKPDQAGDPVVPEQVSFTVDQTLQEADGNLLLLSKDQKSIFRWSPSERRYTGSFPLPKVPVAAALSGDRHSIYLANADWSVGRLDLAEAQPAEHVVFYLASLPRNLVFAGDYLVVVDSDLEVYTADGTRVATTFAESSGGLQWDPVSRRLYQSDRSAMDLDQISIGLDGTFGCPLSSHGPNFVNLSSVLSLAPGGLQVALGSGDIFTSGEPSSFLTKLTNSFSDVVWTDAQLITIRGINGVTQLQTWKRASSFERDTVTRQFAGTPVSLKSTPQGLVVVTSVKGSPQFHLLNDAFEVVFESMLRPDMPTDLSVSHFGENAVSLSWSPVGSAADRILVSYRLVGDSDWIAGPIVSGSASGAVVTGLASAGYYEFRIQAETQGLSSGFTATVTSLTLGAGQPDGEPYHLRVVEVLANQATLSWTDNTTDESGFDLFRDHVLLGHLPPNTTTYVDRPLSPGRSYSYTVQVTKGSLSGNDSAAVTVEIPLANSYPQSPADLVAVPFPGKISLSWRDQSDNEIRYAVDRRPADSTDWEEIGSVVQNTTHWDDLSAVPGNSYSYRVRAVGIAQSTWGNFVTAIAIPPGGSFLSLSKNQDGIYYFAMTYPDRIERYDLRNRSWLSPVPLNGTCTALWVDDVGIYAAEGSRVVRFDPDGSHRTEMGVFTVPVNMLFTEDEVLCYGSNSSYDAWYTQERRTGYHLSSITANIGVRGPVYSPRLKRAFWSHYTAAPIVAEVEAISIGSTGNPTKRISGDDLEQNPSRIFLSPSQDRVVADSGVVYSSDSMSFSGGLGTPILDLDFFSDETPVALRAGRVFAYTGKLQEAGWSDLKSTSGVRLGVSGQSAIVFGPDLGPHGLGTEIVDRSQLTFPVPTLAPDPRGLAFKPDFAWIDRDGVVIMLSLDQAAVFRWSPDLQRYLPSLPLTAKPLMAAYSAEENILYIARKDQTVRKMDLSQAQPREVPAFNAPIPLIGMTVAGHYPFLAMGWFNLTYGEEWIGRTDSNGSDRSGITNIWNPVKKAVYHSDAKTGSPPLVREVIGADGSITSWKTGGGSVQSFSRMAISPDGSRLAEMYAGTVFDTETLYPTASIAGGMVDALWLPNAFLTLHPSSVEGQSLLKIRDPASYAMTNSLLILQGNPSRLLLSKTGKTIVIIIDKDMPRFLTLKDDLSVIANYDPHAAHPYLDELHVDSGAGLQLNPDTGLYECTVTITNNSADSVAGFDLHAMGLPDGAVLYNGGGSSLAYHRALHSGESVTLRLQFLVPGGPGNAVLSFDISFAQEEQKQEFAVQQILRNADGTVSLAFPTEPGSRYVIEYSSNIADWTTAAFGIQAAGTSVQWTDGGKPVTDSAPSAHKTRFYRIRQLNP